MNISLELLKRYPWLPSLKEYYAEIALKDPLEFINDVFSKQTNNELERRTKAVFSAAFDRLEQIHDYRNDELNIYVYLVLKIFLYAMDNKIISNRVANLFSKQAYNDLISKADDADIYDICTDLELKFEYSNVPYQYGYNYHKDQIETLKTNFKIHFVDYLRLSSNLHDDYRKLVHNALNQGFVFIDRKDLLRLLQEYVRIKILAKEEDSSETIKKFRTILLENPKIKALYDEILDTWELKKEEFEYSFELKFGDNINISESFPPCIKEILRKIEEGQNVIHIERLFLVFFLHALNYPRENIIEIFSRTPDFDPKIAEYQIDFAKKKEYTPHSCQTLKSLNLCMAQRYKDEICLEGYYSKKLETKRSLTHPLFYVQLKEYRKATNKKDKTNI